MGLKKDEIQGLAFSGYADWPAAFVIELWSPHESSLQARAVPAVGQPDPA